MLKLPTRQSHRLKGYDYSRDGLYFLTLVTQDKVERFGKISNGDMVLNTTGKMILSEWGALPQRFPQLELDAFTIMPNHIHGILILDNTVNVGAIPCGRPPINTMNSIDKRVDTRPTPTQKNPKIGDIISAFKSITTNRYINGVKMGLVEPFRKRLWQRDYYDHIIRNEKECAFIEQYIKNNPQNWQDDRLRKREGVMEERAEYNIDFRNWM